jgi:hypothetical protein
VSINAKLRDISFTFYVAFDGLKNAQKMKATIDEILSNHLFVL